MNRKAYLFGLLIYGLMTTPLYAVDALDELNMGLSKGSVFETPTPSASHYADIETGKSKRSSVAYSTLPPQVTHTFAEYLPITLDENECLDCHDRRKYLNRKDWQWKVGRKLPMPDDHYGSFEKQGGSEDVAGARYNCTQCHVQMSDAVPLVENTFKQ